MEECFEKKNKISKINKEFTLGAYKFHACCYLYFTNVLCASLELFQFLLFFARFSLDHKWNFGIPDYFAMENLSFWVLRILMLDRYCWILLLYRSLLRVLSHLRQQKTHHFFISRFYWLQLFCFLFSYFFCKIFSS